ncbi:hypothetical protein U9K52_09640 [Chryseobacterium sp. MHB01]|uniref:hypothetical protein n=1 Tax=Chryseobacterium sp. MHB01 TaxID=3109433 RepID=UPI002AFEDDC8|nr:hypothetical protein [Chryseobacterium sp. MHB01]MEA1849173.1 hypothetical protein [Chryseobacterium sp. MHB01]
MSNKNKLKNIIEKHGFTMALYEMTLSVFGTFYSGSVVDANNKIVHDFEGVGIDEAKENLLNFFNKN